MKRSQGRRRKRISGRQRNEVINRSKKMNEVGEEWNEAKEKEAEKKSENVWKW